MSSVAEELGLSPSYIYRIENGSSAPPRGQLLFDFLKIYGDIGAKHYEELVRNLAKKPGVKKPKSKGKRQSNIILTAEAKVLKILRQNRNLSIRDATENVGYSRGGTYISKIENGRANPPSGRRLDKFLKLYGVNLRHYKRMVGQKKLRNDENEQIQDLIKKLKPKDQAAILFKVKDVLNSYP